MTDNSNILLLHHHMGIGDHIALNGMVFTLLDDHGYESVKLFCKDRYLQMFKELYTDPRIELLGVADCHTIEEEIHQVDAIAKQFPDAEFVRLGFDQYRPQPNKTCDQVFYEMADIPYQNKYTHFRMNRNREEEDRVFRKLNPSGEDYVFVHDSPDRGWNISVQTPYKIIRNDPSENLFHYGKIIENAKELHCVESSFRCMSEHLDMSAVRLVYHPIRPGVSITSIHKWEVA
jgi:hypothetical protein